MAPNLIIKAHHGVELGRRRRHLSLKLGVLLLVAVLGLGNHVDLVRVLRLFLHLEVLHEHVAEEPRVGPLTQFVVESLVLLQLAFVQILAHLLLQKRFTVLLDYLCKLLVVRD